MPPIIVRRQVEPDPRALPPWSRPIADLDKILTASQLATVLARLRSQKLTDAKEWGT